MKKRTVMLWGIVTGTLLLILAGCPPAADPCAIPGLWLMKENVCIFGCIQIVEILELKEDGTFEIRGSFLSAEEEGMTMTGEWSVEDSEITLVFDYKEGESYTYTGTVDCSSINNGTTMLGSWSARKIVYL